MTKLNTTIETSKTIPPAADNAKHLKHNNSAVFGSVYKVYKYIKLYTGLIRFQLDVFIVN